MIRRPRKLNDCSRLTYWQRLWARSVVNGAAYFGESLPAQPIQFPRGTFLQTRLEQARKETR